MRIARMSLALALVLLWTSAPTHAEDTKPQTENEQRLSALEVEKAEVELEKMKAELAEANSKASGISGDLKLGEKAGVIEASILAARALGPIGEEIRCRLKGLQGAVGAKFVLFAGTESADTSRWELFDFRVGDMNDTLSKLKADFREQSSLEAVDFGDILDVDSKVKTTRFSSDPSKISAKLSSRSVSAYSAFLGAPTKVLGGLSRFVSYANTDYEVSGVEVGADNELAIAAIADSTSGVGPKFYLPARITRKDAAESVYNSLKDIAKLSVDVTDLAAAAEAKSAKLKNDIKKAEAKDQKVPDLKAKASKIDAIVARSKEALSQYGSFMKSVLSIEGTAQMPLWTIVSQKALSDTLGNNGYAVFVKMTSAGGGSYTKKSMWTFLGAMPFFVSGGAVVSYIAVSRADGSVASSGAIAFQCRYQKASRVANKEVLLTCSSPSLSTTCPLTTGH